MTAALIALLVLAALSLLVTYKGASFILYDPTRKPHVIWPEQFRLRFERVEFPNADHQRLRGWIVHPPEPGPEPRLLVMCHGWGANKGDILEETRFLAEKGGFHLFYFDFRACGESDGEVSTIGYLESLDLDAALKYLRREHPKLVKRMGIFGMSMGGAVAITGLARHKDLKAGVIESAFTSYEQVISRWNKGKTWLPDFPLIPMTRAWIRLRLGADPEPWSPIHHIDKLESRPMFYITGDQDWLMPTDEAVKLHERTPGPKDLWIVPGAGHGKCWRTSPVEYERKVLAFFEGSV